MAADLSSINLPTLSVFPVFDSRIEHRNNVLGRDLGLDIVD
jgi:hypothetical protein